MHSRILSLHRCVACVKNLKQIRYFVPVCARERHRETMKSIQLNRCMCVYESIACGYAMQCQWQILKELITNQFKVLID